jgi:hypothetical protein
MIVVVAVASLTVDTLSFLLTICLSFVVFVFPKLSQCRESETLNYLIGQEIGMRGAQVDNRSNKLI